MHRIRKRFTSLKGAVVAGLALGAAVCALPQGAAGQVQPSEAAPGQPQPTTPEKPKPENTLNVHGTLNLVYTTDYITRGVLLENQGAIFQPSAELAFTLFDNPDAPSFGKGSVLTGIWNSVHSNHEFAGPTLSSWYEFDWYVGAAVDITPQLNLNVLYQEFLSPSDAFGTCKNAQFKVSYNDGKHWESGAPWEGFSLSPYAIVFFELDGKAGTGSDEGIYLELGIGPSYTFNPQGTLPIKVTVPVTVGLGFNDFYGSGLNPDGSYSGADNETFGFASVGLVGSVPINFLTDRGYGAWTFSVGGFYYYFGDGVSDFNDAFAGGGDENEFVLTAGLSMSF